MNRETVQYVFTYFGHLMTEEEQVAWRHYSSTLKLEGNNNQTVTSFYEKHGWLSNDSVALGLLKDGYENFEMNVAKRILINNEGQIFLNKCAKCDLLARTPNAKQCRYCGYDWH